MVLVVVVVVVLLVVVVLVLVVVVLVVVGGVGGGGAGGGGCGGGGAGAGAGAVGGAGEDSLRRLSWLSSLPAACAGLLYYSSTVSAFLRRLRCACRLRGASDVSTTRHSDVAPRRRARACPSSSAQSEAPRSRPRFWRVYKIIMVVQQSTVYNNTVE